MKKSPGISLAILDQPSSKKSTNVTCLHLFDLSTDLQPTTDALVDPPTAINSSCFKTLSSGVVSHTVLLLYNRTAILNIAKYFPKVFEPIYIPINDGFPHPPNTSYYKI